MNWKKVLVLAMVVLSVVSFVGLSCFGNEAAAAGKPTVYVVVDRGIESSFTPAQVKNRHAVSVYMEKDMPAVAEQAGFTAVILPNSAAFVPGPGKYLLKVKVTSYNPGSQAARMMVGYGAGTVTMDTNYELRGPGGAVLLADKTHVGSSVSWQKVVRKIDVDTAKAVAAKLPK
jgi:hypothetical protein